MAAFENPCIEDNIEARSINGKYSVSLLTANTACSIDRASIEWALRTWAPVYSRERLRATQYLVPSRVSVLPNTMLLLLEL